MTASLHTFIARLLCLVGITAIGATLNACDTGRHDNATRSAATSAAAVASSPPAVPFAPARVEFKGGAMGTNITVVAYTTEQVDEAALQVAIEAAMSEVGRLEALMSSWKPDSEVSRLNQKPGSFVPVSPETLEVIEKGLWAGKVSEGTFDLTFQTLSPLWKFGDAQEQSPVPPSRAEVERLRPRVDYRKVEVDHEKRLVKIAPDQQLGLGGVAKGYIVDKAAKVLLDRGVKAFLFRAGGDLFGVGKKPDGEPWVAGIQDPRGNQDGYFATLELTNHAFSTAGDYARSYVYKGKRYHHIIDPRTGYPATACRSVTIWAESALLADVIDDSVFILGPEKGLALVESIPGAGAVIVDASNEVWISKRLQGKVTVLHPPTPSD